MGAFCKKSIHHEIIHFRVHIIDIAFHEDGILRGNVVDKCFFRHFSQHDPQNIWDFCISLPDTVADSLWGEVEMFREVIHGSR